MSTIRLRDTTNAHGCLLHHSVIKFQNIKFSESDITNWTSLSDFGAIACISLGVDKIKNAEK